MPVDGLSNGLFTKSVKPDKNCLKANRCRITDNEKGCSLPKRKILSTGNNNKRFPYLITENNNDYTPKPLEDSDYQSISDKTFVGLPFSKRRGQAGAMLSRMTSRTPSSTSVLSGLSRFSKVVLSKKPTYSSSLSSLLFTETVTINLSLTIEETSEEDKPPSLFIRREDPLPRCIAIPRTFTVILKETDTFFLLNIKSTVEDYCISDEVNTVPVNASNAHNECNVNASNNKDSISGVSPVPKTKTFSHTAIQTADLSSVMKKRTVFMGRNKRSNASSYASKWDIYDAYEKESRNLEMKKTEGNKRLQFYDCTEDCYIRYKGTDFGMQFFNTVMTMERLISAPSNKANQRLFVGLIQSDPFSQSVQFNYNLKLMWSLKNEFTSNKVITSLSWSPINDNMLAVGYGKFKYSEMTNGAVCCWNIKNPVHAERIYTFKNAVTSVSFSKQFPYMLAVSFYSGLVILLDVTKRNVVILASNEMYPLHHPIWQTDWFPNEEVTGKEYLVTCGRDGRVYRYRKTEIFKSKKILSVARMYSRIQGVEQSKRCYANRTLVSRHPSAECIVPHPEDPLIYFVGTSEGCIYKCSVNYCHHHLDVFAAHNGPVYGIKFHPHCNKVFLTYGGDWYVRIWAEGIYEPLIALNSGMQAVEAALWDPLNSTIIISITGECIEIWDIRRKTYTPKSVSRSPTTCLNTAIAFARNGYNLCVGDAKGNLHIYALTEMPFPPVFQENVLVHCLIKTLVCKPQLLRKLRKLGPPFSDDEDTFQKKLYLKLKKIHHL